MENGTIRTVLLFYGLALLVVGVARPEGSVLVAVLAFVGSLVGSIAVLEAFLEGGGNMETDKVLVAGKSLKIIMSLRDLSATNKIRAITAVLKAYLDIHPEYVDGVFKTLLNDYNYVLYKEKKL